MYISVLRPPNQDARSPLYQLFSHSTISTSTAYSTTPSAKPFIPFLNPNSIYSTVFKDCQTYNHHTKEYTLQQFQLAYSYTMRRYHRRLLYQNHLYRMNDMVEKREWMVVSISQKNIHYPLKTTNTNMQTHKQIKLYEKRIRTSINSTTKRRIGTPSITFCCY